MEVVLDVDGIAYCALEIENVKTPPTINFVDTIYLQDGGFGTPVPVLQLILSDSNGTLDEDLNLQDGTKITIKLSKSREKLKIKDFRVFSFEKQTAADGPKMIVTCLFDAPEWVAGVYTESFEGSSSSAIQQMASRAGLKYDGPKGTDDSMIWLNVNRTRTSFSEDIAMRGYSNPQSCMSRLLTSEGVVRYKDLFEEIQKAPMYTYLKDTDESAAQGTPVTIRETHNASVSGLQTHLMNYGQTQYSHSLDVAGQKDIDGLDAPVIGNSLPINDEVKGMVHQRGSRITYTGFDPGTFPKPASNLHEYYEDAQYQNLRYLGLFSERLKILTDDYTEVQPFDVADYRQSDALKGEFEEKRLLGGNWIVGGKTIWIKAGHKYSELHFLYRPTLQDASATPAAGSDANDAKNATADASGDRQDDIARAIEAAPEIKDSVTEITPQQSEPAIESAQKALDNLDKYADQTSGQNSPVLNQANPPGKLLEIESKLRGIFDKLASGRTKLSDIYRGSVVEGIFGDYVTIKKFDSRVVEYLANISPRDIVNAIRNPEQFKASSMDRILGDVSDLTGVNMHNVVAAIDGDHYRIGAIVGDVLDGGMWGDSLRQAGFTLGDIGSIGADLPWLEKVANAGGKFLYDMTGIGISSEGVAFNPRKFAEQIEYWANSGNAKDMLMREGFRAFESTFGNMTPQEADSAMEKLAKLAGDVALKYAESELLYDHGLSDYEISQIGRDVLLTFGDPSIAPLIDEVIDIYNYNGYTDVLTKKSVSTWADYYSMGVAASGVDWKFPFNFPADGPTEISDNTGGFSNVIGDFFKWKN